MADTPKQGIEKVRSRIDHIDSQIVNLLKERLDLAKEIGRLKDEGKRAKWDPQRER
jgi:chorismate mutase/prephenate dehydratase